MHSAFDRHRRQRQQQRDDQRDRQAGGDVGHGDAAPQESPHQHQPAQHPYPQNQARHRVSPNTAEMYWPRSSTSSAARPAYEKNGPASTVSVRPTAISAPVGSAIPIGIRPTWSRSTNWMSSGSSRSAEGSASERWPSGASSRDRQNAMVHTRATTYSVSRLVRTPPPTSSHASTEPFCAPASSSATLPMKPENGGTPPRLSAGTTNRNASSGLAAASPPSRCIVDAPAWRSIRPTTRNSVVCTTMWCAT